MRFSTTPPSVNKTASTRNESRKIDIYSASSAFCSHVSSATRNGSKNSRARSLVSEFAKRSRKGVSQPVVLPVVLVALTCAVIESSVVSRRTPKARARMTAHPTQPAANA